MLVQFAITALVGLVLYTLWSFSTPTLNAEFGCHCGQVQGKVAASSILHVVCYCDDCQAMDTRVRVKYPKLATGLNECGGMRAVMVFPSEVTIASGANKLTVVKLKDRTTTRRVYASCCGSHLINAVTPEIPLMAIPASAFLDKHVDLGTPQVHFFTKYATGDVPRGYSAMPFALQLKIASRILLNGSKTRPRPIDAKQPANVLS
ncbi:unnamed protein product [Aphanomyces euteiches]|nr:hypothetical protein AeRB84_004059 [Aphanomyces euteiches]